MLTSRQRQFAEYLEAELRAGHPWPTYRKIARDMGCAVSSAHRHIQQLRSRLVRPRRDYFRLKYSKHWNRWSWPKMEKIDDDF